MKSSSIVAQQEIRNIITFHCFFGNFENTKVFEERKKRSYKWILRKFSNEIYSMSRSPTNHIHTQITNNNDEGDESCHRKICFSIQNMMKRIIWYTECIRNSYSESCVTPQNFVILIFLIRSFWLFRTNKQTNAQWIAICKRHCLTVRRINFTRSVPSIHVNV